MQEQDDSSKTNISVEFWIINLRLGLGVDFFKFWALDEFLGRIVTDFCRQTLIFTCPVKTYPKLRFMDKAALNVVALLHVMCCLLWNWTELHTYLCIRSQYILNLCQMLTSNNT